MTPGTAETVSGLDSTESVWGVVCGWETVSSLDERWWRGTETCLLLAGSRGTGNRSPTTTCCEHVFGFSVGCWKDVVRESMDLRRSVAVDVIAVGGLKGRASGGHGDRSRRGKKKVGWKFGDKGK